jgi:hypothetical protein
VLLSRFHGTFTADDIDRVDKAVMTMIGRAGPVRGILDFSDVDAMDIPAERLAERARQPQIAAGQERVFVASKPLVLSMAEAYAARQHAFGAMAPHIVGTLAEAYTLLGLVTPRFEPMDLG